MGTNKPKLNYIFHNPNSNKDLAEVLYKIFLDSCKEKIDSILMEKGKDEITGSS